MSKTKYRIKKLSEFKKDYTADVYGDYLVDGTWFNTSNMRHLCGVELTDVEARLLLSSEKNRALLTLSNGPAGKHNEWHFSRGMITEIKTTKKSYLKDMSNTKTKYRIKTSKELANDYITDCDGDYLVGDKIWFNTGGMSHLYGVELTDSEACQILSLDKDDNVRLDLQNGPAGKDNHWLFTRGMITEIKTTKKSKDMKETTQTISRQGLESIYNVACDNWKDKIAVDITADKPFAKEYEISNDYISKMFKASSAEQKAVLIAAGLKDPTEKVSRYAKITSCGAGRENSLLPFQLDMGDQSPLEILIGAGLVSSEYKQKCLISVTNKCDVVPEVLFNVEDRDWMIVFKKKS